MVDQTRSTKARERLRLSPAAGGARRGGEGRRRRSLTTAGLQERLPSRDTQIRMPVTKLNAASWRPLALQRRAQLDIRWRCCSGGGRGGGAGRAVSTLHPSDCVTLEPIPWAISAVPCNSADEHRSDDPPPNYLYAEDSVQCF